MMRSVIVRLDTTILSINQSVLNAPTNVPNVILLLRIASLPVHMQLEVLSLPAIVMLDTMIYPTKHSVPHAVTNVRPVISVR